MLAGRVRAGALGVRIIFLRTGVVLGRGGEAWTYTEGGKVLAIDPDGTVPQNRDLPIEQICQFDITEDRVDMSIDPPSSL